MEYGDCHLDIFDQIERDGSAALLDHVLYRQDEIVRCQADWEDDEPFKHFDFTVSPFWAIDWVSFADPIPYETIQEAADDFTDPHAPLSKEAIRALKLG